MVPISYYLILSGILFACGVTGFLIKRNIISIFMSIELMLNGVNLSFVAFAAQWHALSGQVFVFFVMVVAAAEAAVGLAIIISGVPHARNPERGPGGPAQTMTPDLHLWLIPVLPLVGAAINGFFGKKFSRQTVAGLAPVVQRRGVCQGLSRGIWLLFPGDAAHRDPGDVDPRREFSGRLRFLSRPTFAGDAAGRDRRRLPHSHLFGRLHVGGGLASIASSPT